MLFFIPSEVNAKVYGMSGWYWKFDGKKILKKKLSKSLLPVI